MESFYSYPEGEDGIYQKQLAFYLNFCISPTIFLANFVKSFFEYLKQSSNFGIKLKFGFKKTSVDYLFTQTQTLQKSSYTAIPFCLCWVFNEMLFQQKLRMQNCFSLSTAELEYFSLSDCASDIKWTLNYLREANLFSELPVPLFSDSNNAKARSERDPSMSKTKNVEINYFFLQELVTRRFIQMIKINTQQNIADMFIKPLHKILKWKFQTIFGMVDAGGQPQWECYVSRLTLHHLVACAIL